MVRLSTLQPAQIAAENWAYPTSLLPRRWADLNALKALFFKKGETLGTDGGDTGYSVTHTNRAADEPLYTRLATGTTSGYGAYSYGYHNIAKLDRLPVGGLCTRKMFECQTRLEQTATCAITVGFCNYVGIEPGQVAAHIFYDSSVGVNFQARSYETTEEQTDTGVAADTSYHVFQIALSASDVKFYIDGTLKATHTTQVPNAGLYTNIGLATVQVITRAAAAAYARYTYVAVWLE